MNTGTTVTAALFLATAGLFGGCALNPHPMDMTTAVRNAKTPADHQALADHYEQAAQEADAKAAEHRQTLQDYKAKPYVLGRQGPAWQAHCEAMIGAYQQVAQENRAMAGLHRQMAAGIQ